ncbi:MAG: Calx-beta domain-containing protein, partial [Hoeflea sp.]|uniref:Calx-beta domain-containing protein n=1 Tax=Hoeflea sp. TaxID=1940281 RepID=UPI003296F47D
MGLVVFLDADDIKGKTITTAGYPGTFSDGTQDGRTDDNTARTLYSATGKVDGVESGDLRITYDESVDTQGGQSGSGVWYDDDLFGENVELVAAIHHWGTNNVFQNGGGVNAGVLITKDLYDAFMESIRVDTNGAGAAALPENAIVGTDSFLTLGGNDVIEGTYRKERIIGQGGEDQIRGGGSDDRLEGGAGVDQAIFSGEFKDFTFTENPDGSYTFADGNAGDGLDEGTDSLKDFEFAIFEKANASDTEVFIVPLPIKDGPDTRETGDIKSVDGTATVGAATLEAPAWMFDGDIDYTFTLSGSAIGSLYNFAYIIDKSGSMSGSNLQIAQQAYQTLTQDLISRGVADFSDFVVVPFNSSATSSGTLDAQGAIAAVNALSAGGGTSFTQALSLAETWFNSQADHQNAINIAFFLSDGQGTGASANLQQLNDGTRIEVRAYGIGNGADLNSLNIIDSDNAVLLTDPADLIDEFKKAGVSKDVIDRIEVKLDGVLVDTILPDQLTEDPLGLQITGSISGLEVTRTAKNLVTFDVVFNDGRPTSTVTKEITTGQEEIIKQTANGTKIVELAVGQTSFLGSVLGAFNSIINGNEVSNQVTDGVQNDQIFTFGGDDIISMTGGGTNLVDGGDGLDVVTYSGSRPSFGSVVKSGGVVKVGTDSIINVEQIQFDDVVIDTATMQESIFATLSPAGFTIDEEASDVARQATFTVTLAKAASSNVDVQFSILSGTATAGTDYSGADQLVTIAAGQTTAGFTVQILNDQEVEQDETLLVQADLGVGAKFRSGSSVAQSGVVIDDGDIALSVGSLYGFVFEGDSGSTAQLSVSVVRAGDTADAMSVNYAVQGITPDAADAADFLNGLLPSGTVNFAAGQSSVNITLTIQGDDIVEPTESFEVVLSNPSITVSSLSGAVFQISNRVQFSGTSNGETVTGNEIDNELFGLGGNDTLEGRLGADILNGGEGTDTATYYRSAQGVIVNMGNGTGTGGEAQGDTLFSIENVTGSPYADILYGNGFANVLSGGDEADTLFGFTGMDVLYGDRGNDRLEGGDDADILIGGDGTDTAIYAQSAQGVTINLGNGTGTAGEAQGDTLFDIENVEGSAQADILYGNGFANVLSGGNAADRLFGFTGMDVLSGDGGNDRLEGGADADVLIGGAGIDTAIYAQSGQGVTINLGNGTGTGGEAEGDMLFDIENVEGSAQADILYGNGFANVLSGGDEADRLFGFTGMDVLSGDGGDDMLEGGADADVLIGGSGIDTARYSQSAQGVTINLGTGTGTGGEAEGDML